MEEYTGNYFTIENSRVFDGQTVNVLECKASDGGWHGTCFRCGRKLRRHWYEVQSEDDLLICAIGAECVKKLT